MRAKACLVVALVAAGAAWGQTPDVTPFLELHPSWQVRSTKKSLFNWYDPMGRYSLVGLRMILESGHRVYVAQRFQRVENSGDPDTVDEYYVEKRGHWRIGKQYLPFGRREILHSTVLAARVDTQLLLDEAPISVSACDGGPGRTRGVFGRIGGVVGLSFAVGDHIGIQATDFVKFENPEDAPGQGRGHKLAFGFDTLVSVGDTTVAVEWASLRQGETPLDRDRDLSDVRLRFQVPGAGDRMTLGWSRDWSHNRDTSMLEIQFGGGGKVAYVPMVRFDGFSFRDFSLSAVMRL